MSNDSRPRGHPLKWWQVLSLIGAGGLSFLGSAYWSMSAGSVPEEEVGQDGRALAMNQVEDRARNTSAVVCTAWSTAWHAASAEA